MSWKQPNVGAALGRARGNPWVVLVTLCFGFFMTLLDTAVVGVAIPNMIGSLHTTYAQVLWVSNAYTIVLTIFLITSGRLGDILGMRNIFLTGVAVFTAASLACALSVNVSELIAARTVQGLGAAMLLPQTMSIIITVFPPDRRGAALGIWGAVAGIAAVSAQPLGGFLVSTAGWHWIFTINLPVGVLVLLFAPLVIPRNLQPRRRHTLDVLGIVLATGGLFCLTFGLEEGQAYHWTTIVSFVSIPAVFGAAVVLLAAFAVNERFRQGREPMIPAGLIRDRNYSLINLAAIGLSIGIISMAIGFQLYAQTALHVSALTAGLVSAPLAVVSTVLGPVIGRLSDRIGGRYLVTTGFLVFACGILAFLFTSRVGTAVWAASPSMLIMGAGLGCTFAPLTTVAMYNVPLQLAGTASGLLNTMRQFGTVVGTAGFGALLQNRLGASLGGHASQYAATLPADVRGRFVTEMRDSALNGTVRVSLPSGTSPQVAHQVQEVAQRAFSVGFVDALHDALFFPIGALLLSTACCVFVTQQRRAPTPATHSSPTTERAKGQA
jgi:EmrB/QacA subfamily drug resistance transporter